MDGGFDVVEAEWVKRAQAGDRAALIQILREMEAPLYQTAFYLLGSEQDALDATQEALLRIYKKVSTFKWQSRFETWAQRIVTNLCIDQLRRKGKTAFLKEEVEPIDPQAEVAMQFSGFTTDLQAAMERLSELQRAVVIFRYGHDFTYAEIAEVLELPLNTVKSHLFRARKQLQEELAEYREGGVTR